MYRGAEPTKSLNINIDDSQDDLEYLNQMSQIFVVPSMNQTIQTEEETGPTRVVDNALT
jgi:hypothetical protein